MAGCTRANTATVGDVLASIDDPDMTAFVTNLYSGRVNTRLNVVDLTMRPEGMSFVENGFFTVFKKECEEWAKHGNKRPVERLLVEKYRKVGEPSTFGKPSGWSTWQEDNPDLPIMAHRPADDDFSWVNLLIMHPIFGEIVKILESGTPSSEDYVMAAELCAYMPDAYKVENSRRDAINKIFNKHLPATAVDAIGVNCVADSFDTDGTCAIAGTNIEYKNEKGKGDSDPYMQNIAYYIQYWGAAKNTGRMKNKKKRGVKAQVSIPGSKLHCCPWMLVEVIGQEIGISVAAFVDGTPCAQPLSLNVPFLAVTSDRRMRMHQARLCQAMRYGFKSLKTFYSNQAGVVEDPQAGFPFQRAFTPFASSKAAAAAAAVAAEVRFSYTRPLVRGERRMLFVAKIDGSNEQVLVKFSERYNAEAHKLAADHGLAPGLRGIEQLDCGLVMVVMDLVANETYHQWGTKGKEGDSARSLLMNFQKLFRSNNLVHGDLRPPNLLVVTPKDKNDDVKLLVVDFDWAGLHGVSIYPVAVNPGEIWHDGVEAGQKMLMEHDDFMVNRLVQMSM